jgi:CheY-like chemotaxis protein
LEPAVFSAQVLASAGDEIAKKPTFPGEPFAGVGVGAGGSGTGSETKSQTRRNCVTGKLLIVEDEPIVALDLKQEVEQLGHKVVGVAESADEALAAVKMCRTDLALMDVRIMGSMDGIETARLLRSRYHIPSIFLTSYSDETTISRAAREIPYGYLTKPFQSGELMATLQVALHKTKVDARQSAAHRKVAATVAGIREGVVRLSAGGKVQFMNVAAETLTGWTQDKAIGLDLKEVLNLTDQYANPLFTLPSRAVATTVEEFGWTLRRPDGSSILVDLCIAQQPAQSQNKEFVITLRNAAGRMRWQAIEEDVGATRSFDQAPMGMVQLDHQGYIMRVNEAMVRESGVGAEKLLGRSLIALSMDPEAHISQSVLHTLLQGSIPAATARPRLTN